MKQETHKSLDQIEGELSRTRAEMDETLSAIENRLTPGHLVDQGMAYLRQSGAQEFASNLRDQVSRNPLPVTLVGLGVAWLMMSTRQPGDGTSGVHSSLRDLQERTSDTMHRVAGTAHAAGEHASDTMHRMAGAAHAAGERLSESAHAARDRIAHAASGTRERARQFSEGAHRQYERARSGYQHLREQPLALGAVGIAVGALLAAALPRTRQEDVVLGEARDRLAERASEFGREQLAKAERVASAAGQAAAEEAQRAAASGSEPSATPSVVSGDGERYPGDGERYPGDTAAGAGRPADRPEPRPGP